MNRYNKHILTMTWINYLRETGKNNSNEQWIAYDQLWDIDTFDAFLKRKKSHYNERIFLKWEESVLKIRIFLL